VKTSKHLSVHNDAAASETPITGASTHAAIPLPGCVVHSPLHVDVAAWISRKLRCVEDNELPASRLFMNFDATFQVQTFDDIDICVSIAANALSLEPIATIGLRELIVNAVEHGNLEIDFAHKSDLLANGEWQDEIERRLATRELGSRFAAVQMSRDDNDFEIQITDQGPGFDWQTHIDPDTAPTHMLHGRGMSLAMGAGFESIRYYGTGNQVVVRGLCALDQNI
jgi:hypothetical protein